VPDTAAVPDPRSLDRQIWALAAPAVLTLAAEPLYLLADTAIVARVGPVALGGLAVASAILLFVTGMLIFLTFGTAASVARLLGADDPAEAAELSVQGLWLGALLGVVVAVAVGALAEPLIALFGATPEVADGARTYLLISLPGVPAMTLVRAGTGALRGHLDTRTPLAVSVGSNTLNLVLELWLVLGLRWGLAGSALGTVIAKWVAAAAYTAIVVGMVRRAGVGLRPDRRRIVSLAVVGRDLFVRTVALRASLSLTLALAARKGTSALAAWQVAFQWWAFLAYLLDALEAAAQSLVARALGAADRSLARRTARRILAWALGAGVVVGLLTALLSAPIASWFAHDAEVRSLLAMSLVWVGVSQPVNALAFALDGVLVGAGDQRFLAGAMVASSLVLAAGAVLLGTPSRPLWALWLLVVVFMATRVVLLGNRYRGTAWERTGSLGM
jgi:putative MATE family efflux protein